MRGNRQIDKNPVHLPSFSPVHDVTRTNLRNQWCSLWVRHDTWRVHSGPWLRVKNKAVLTEGGNTRRCFGFPSDMNLQEDVDGDKPVV